MIEEILYTSAPKGLKPGSQGFCTVSSTVGMAQATAERLEALSGYRHAFPLTDPRATLNPLNYSHLTLRLAGRPTHVLSRIANAGHDYSGRSNKLAHHLAFEHTAAWPSGPARMLQTPGVMVTEWDGTLQTFAPRTLTLPPLPPRIQLSAWKQCSGDHGWAGWVAEQLLQQPVPLHVIFAPGTPTLDLVREVLDLLPPARRWDITFSTYFTRLPAGVDCRLRFVLDETPEATSLRHDARARVLDLTQPLPPPRGGQLVATAQSGLLINSPSAPSHQGPGSADPAASSKAPPPIPPALAATPSTADSGRPRTLVPGLADEPFSLHTARRRQPRKASATVRSAAIAVLLLISLTAAWYTGAINLPVTGDSVPPPEPELGHVPAADAVMPANESLGPDTPTPGPPLRNSKQTQPAHGNAPDPDPAMVEVATSTPPSTAPAAPTAPEPAPPTTTPPATAADKSATATAPATNPRAFSLMTTPLTPDPEPTFLWDWHAPEAAKTPAPLPLLLSGPKPELQITPSAAFNKHAAEASATNSFYVTINRQSEDPITWDVGATNGQTVLPVGKIHLRPAEDGSPPAATHLLEFHWNTPTDPGIATLVRWCPLELTAEGVTVNCALRPPESLQTISLSQFLASGYMDAIALSHEQFRPLVPNDLGTLRLGIELHRDGVSAAPLEIPAAAEARQFLLDADGNLTSTLPPTGPIPPDSLPIVSLGIRVLPPVRGEGGPGQPRIETELKARIPCIGLSTAAKPRRSETDTKFFAELLKRKSQQRMAAADLQRAFAQLSDLTDDVDLRFSSDVAPDDPDRRLQSAVGSRFQDAADVCSNLIQKLPALQKDLEAHRSKKQEELAVVSASKEPDDAKKAQLLSLEQQISQTTAAFEATEELLVAVSAQQTWFNTNRGPHLQALTRQLIGLRSTPLRVVFFIDFPAPAESSDSRRGRVRLMEVRLSSSSEAAR
ncbi:MAG: hypothetical protein ACKO2P_03620 [Planctomycetota bacterium]